MNNVKPSYYNNNGADVIEMLSKVLEPGEFRGFMKGNIIKYATRYDKKNGLEDLDKCAEYKFRLSIWEITGHTTTLVQDGSFNTATEQGTSTMGEAKAVKLQGGE